MMESLETPESSVAYLLGALRDGSVYYDRASRNYFTVFYQKHREWLQDSIGNRLAGLYGLPYRIDEYKPGHYRLRVSSRSLLELWMNHYEFPAGTTQIDWPVPLKVGRAPPEVKRSFVRGVFDAEGDVSPFSSKTCYVGISQKSKGFLDDIAKMLVENGIQPGRLHIIDTATGTWRIAVSRKGSVLRFIKIIGTEHPVKKVKLTEMAWLLEQQT